MNIHPNGIKKLVKLKTYRNIKKFLRSLGCTQSEQKEIVREVKKENSII